MTWLTCDGSESKWYSYNDELVTPINPNTMWKDDKRGNTPKQADRSNTTSSKTEGAKAPVRKRRLAVLDDDLEPQVL